jgi:uncharacterized protein (TIGR03067 family)
MVFAASCDVRSDLPVTHEFKEWQGTWLVTRVERDGRPVADLKPTIFMLAGEKYVLKEDDEVLERGRLVVDPTKDPKHFDLIIEHGDEANEGQRVLGVYELNGDTLRTCAAVASDTARPQELISRPNTRHELRVLKRQKP